MENYSMTKKEYVVKLLTALINDRELAQPLLTLIKRNVLDEEVIDALVSIFKKAVKETTNEIKIEKFKKSIKFLKKIKKAEEKKEKGSGFARNLEI